MEMSSSVIGAMRVGLQVVSSHRTPLIEIYHQLHNRYGPEIEIPLEGSGKHIYKTRIHDIFIQFTMINVGGERAENIKLTIAGDLKRAPPREDYGSSFNNVYPQMAAGQIHHLFRFEQSDLLEYKYEDGVGTPQGLKKSSFTIIVEYDSGSGFLNWAFSVPSKIRGKRRFRTEYCFSPHMVDGALPPADYA